MQIRHMKLINPRRPSGRGRSLAQPVLSALLAALFAQRLVADEMPAPVGRFIETHCALCHAGAEAEAGLDLTKLPTDLERLDDPATFAVWVKVHDRVQAGEMPPKSVETPSTADIKTLLQDLGKTLQKRQAARQLAEGRVPLRRLNRSEYENTMRDLFSLSGLEVKELLPEDGRYDGFDKAGRALDVSAVQLRKYMEAADVVLDAAIAHGSQPTVFKDRFRRVGGLHCFGVDATFPLRDGKLDLAALDAIHPKGERPIGLRERGPYLDQCDSMGILTPARPSFNSEVGGFSPYYSGHYRIRTSVWSFDLADGEVRPASRGQSLALTAGDRLLTYFDAPSLKPQVHERVVWLNRGDTLQLNAASLWANFSNPRNHVGSAVAVDYIDVEGPLCDEWPPASHRRLFGNLPLTELPFERDGAYPRQPSPPTRPPGYRPNHQDSPELGKQRSVWTAAAARPKEDARRLLADFLPRAFRRPVADDELEVYVKIAHAGIERGDFFETAMREAYRTALCSPDFLFLQEPLGLVDPKSPSQLDAYSIAARLSYFLWNSLPDDELTALAAKGKVSGKELIAKIDSMLADPRSDRFVNDFLDQWLELREINFTSPDRRLYPEFRNDLRDAMLAETRAYFREMIDKDLGASHIVQSDFVTINERLAELYGIDGVVGSEIRRVALPPDCPRGGLLTQAAVLKVTANGTVTSPVVRGAWVTDRILGRPPEPPPPNIAAVEPDLRGTTTIREQLEKHRSDASCASCHAKMDPPGLALENFDPIGRWRTQYRFEGDRELELVDQRGDSPSLADFPGVSPRQWEFVQKNVRLGLPVDASGATADGETFRDIRELKRLLLKDEEQIARSLVERLVLYATGATVSFADRTEVDRILDRTRKNGFGLRSILYELAQSGLVRRR
jgi:hypothetical protein